MRKVKVAIDGCGTLTTETVLNHLLEADFKQRAEVVAVCDIVAERAKHAAERLGIGAWFADLDAMLEQSDAEAVLVIVPHEIHAEHARRVVASGRHVYVQKPMARDIDEGRALINEARARGVKLVAAPGQVLWPMYARIREVIESGAIGEPYWAMPPMMGWGNTRVEFPTNPSWFFSESAGPLRDHGGYGFQSLVSLFGPVQRIMTMAAIRVPQRQWNDTTFAVTGPDNTVSLLDHGRGRFGVMPECWCDTAPSVRFFRILGLEGAIETDPETFNHLDILPIGATVRPFKKPPFRIEVPLASVEFTRGRHPEHGHVHVYGDILHLIDCIQNNAEPQASGERALHFVDAIQGALASARDGVARTLSTSV